jgi:hypothetical protein
MSLHSTTRVPVDDSYAALVGKAVYVFAYYEWVLIYIVEYLRAGFVARYSRGDPMTSGQVKQALQSVINDPTADFSKVTRQQLQDCCTRFDELVVKRNALIHAHPCTDTDGSQILAYQTKPHSRLPDMKWPTADVSAMIAEFDKAACDAGLLLDRLR